MLHTHQGLCTPFSSSAAVFQRDEDVCGDRRYADGDVHRILPEMKNERKCGQSAQQTEIGVNIGRDHGECVHADRFTAQFLAPFIPLLPIALLQLVPQNKARTASETAPSHPMLLDSAPQTSL